jgi:D-lactate dehydrogenase
MEKLAFFDVKEKWEKDIILKNFKNSKIFEKTIHEVKLSEFENCEILSVFCMSKCSKDIMSKVKNLKGIFARSTGFDNIDIDYCKENNIKIFTVAHYGENTVAEFAIALLLEISRKINESCNIVREKGFVRENLEGFDLAGKTVGIVGFGNIGSHFAKICQGFDMRVLAYVRDKEKYKKKYPDLKIEFNDDLNSVLKQSDIVSIHLPLNDHTRHVISTKEFNSMKKGVVLLNVSRGELIDDKAFIKALDNRIIKFAGIDVIEGECLLNKKMSSLKEEDKKIVKEDKIILNHKNVLISPHNAFNTIEAKKRILNTTIQNIKDFNLNKTNENEIV